MKKMLQKQVKMKQRNSSIDQEQRMVRSSKNCNWLFCHFGWVVVFDRWSSGRSAHDLRRASQVKELRVFLQEASLSRTSPILWHFPWLLLLFAPRFAVITVVGLLDVLMVSTSAELRSLLLTICMLAPESTTNSFSSSFMVDAAGIIHSFCTRTEWSFVLFFELVNVLARFHALPRAHRSCLSVSSWDLSSNFIA